MFKKRNPGCPCCATVDCDIFSNDFASNIDGFTLTSFSGDAEHNSTDDCFEATAAGVAICTTEHDESPYLSSVSLSFRLGAGSIALWLLRNSSGAGVYALATPGANCGTLQLFESDGTDSTELSGEFAIVGLVYDEWIGFKVCASNSAKPIVSASLWGDTITYNYWGTNLDWEDQVTIEAAYTITPGPVSAFEILDATETDPAQVKDFQFSKKGGECLACDSSCLLLEIPSDTSSLPCDLTTVSGSPSVGTSGVSGTCRVTHNTTVAESPVTLLWQCQMSAVNDYCTVWMGSDYVKCTATDDGEYTLSINGSASKTIDAELEEVLSFIVTQYPATITVCEWGSYLSPATGYAVAARDSGAIQYGIQNSTSGTATSSLKAFRHASQNGLCPYCLACTTCDPDSVPPDTVIVDLGSTAWATDNNCDACDEIYGEFPAVSDDMTCEWNYAEALMTEGDMEPPCNLIIGDARLTIKLALNIFSATEGQTFSTNSTGATHGVTWFTAPDAGYYAYWEAEVVFGAPYSVAPQGYMPGGVCDGDWYDDFTPYLWVGSFDAFFRSTPVFYGTNPATDFPDCSLDEAVTLYSYPKAVLYLSIPYCVWNEETEEVDDAVNVEVTYPLINHNYYNQNPNFPFKVEDEQWLCQAVTIPASITIKSAI